MANDQLKFFVAPHIVQDLGLNLYTSLPRVLVEFVANAYDADSPDAQIALNAEDIARAREVLKREWLLERAKNEGKAGKDGDDLEIRTLPPDVTISILDHGCGMSRDDFQKKFLIAGRRRRTEENRVRTDGERILMGRKGLGKLAGFGIAHTITVVSRKKGEKHATKITLDYDRLIKMGLVNEVPIEDETIKDGGGIDPHGTKVVLSNLVYEPMKSALSTIANAIGDHFAAVGKDNFAVTLNTRPVEPTPRAFVYAYPRPDLDPEKTVRHEYTTDNGDKVEFQYRIRFTGEKKHLQAAQRGMRVYAHKRLAAAPDLLDLPTGIHGFRNTHYLDGIVHADFIDDRTIDYIATDRHTLRWESALLVPMRQFLTTEMQDACNEYQKKRDKDAEQKAREDKFTKEKIEKAKLPAHRRKLAYRVAGLLASVCEGGEKGEEYQTRLPIFLDGLGQGDILNALSQLASEERPELDRLVAQVTELTSREFGDFIKFVQGRLDGIDALSKLYRTVDFRAAKNEDQLHELFEKNPWLIDPTFTQFLTSDKSEDVLNKRLSKYLEIGEHVPKGYDPNAKGETEELGSNKRPDLVFLLSNDGLRRLVIVELKAPNTPLHIEHLQQLKGYIRRAEEWLSDQGGNKQEFKVEGYLIGSKDPRSKSEKIADLRFEIKKEMHKAAWSVCDIGEVLDRTKEAHKDLLKIYERAAARAGADE